MALAGTAAIAAQLTGVVPAQAAAPAITIFATSKLAVITGDVSVGYRGGTYGSATIHGDLTGAAAGEVDAYNFNWAACDKDTVSKDGIGLPGSHGCGYLHRISGTNTPYLG